MSFLKITDPEKRKEMVNEYTRLRKKVYQDSLIQNQDYADARRENIKMFKPIINEQKKNTRLIEKYIQPSLKAIAERKYPILQQSIQPIEEKSEEELEEEQFKKFGPFATEALSQAFGQNDTKYGFRIQDGEYMIGNKEIHIDGDDIVIHDTKYKGTPGLWRLITKPEPNDGDYTAADMNEYKDIMIKTSALKTNYDPESKKPRASRSKKWISILKPIWEEQKQRDSAGSGVVYLSSDPNVLCDRLELLVAANKAGNSAVRNEIVSILDTLKKIEYISEMQYKKINNLINKR